MGQAGAPPRSAVTQSVGTMPVLLVALVVLLASPLSAEPFQCRELKNIIDTCSCEARVFKGKEIPNQVVINCRNQNMSSVPAITGQSNHTIYEMTLAQNNIQTLPAAAFRGLRIQRLDLRNNRLTQVSNSSFQGLENDLKELYLGAERGGNVRPPVGSLIHLEALHTLHLEYFTFDSNIVDPGVLNVMTSLTSLTLRSNQLNGFDSPSLPASLTSLTLDDQSLSSIPTDAIRLLTQLETLAITRTNIPAVYNQAFMTNIKLAHLDLANNRISTLSNGCFAGITTSLLTLSLSNNPITNVASLQEIQELRAVTTLQLSSISLSSLPSAASFLLNKDSLTVLHLDGNALTSLGSDVFSSVPSLQELSLAYNRLSALDPQVFAGLPSLTDLDLGHQTMSSGQGLALPESLTSLTSLQTLRLSKTTVDTATLWTRVSPMGSLKTLLLDGTSLTTVPDNALWNLTRLEEMNLDNNDLSEVTQQMMAGPRNLTRLTLNRNSITTLSHCAFYGFSLSPPLSLELIGNPLHCDCRLRWLLEQRDRGHVTLTGAEMCASPSDKNGSYLLQLQPADLICVPDQPEESCPDPYTTPAPPTTSTAPTPILELTITNVSTTTLSLRWAVSNIPTISYFKVWHTNLQNSQSAYSPEIPAAETSYQVRGLKPDTPYSVCVFASLSSSTTQVQTCQQTKTLSDGSTDKQDGDQSDDSSNVGIIVGTIAAALVLLAIIAAILYLLCWRRRESKQLPSQPHVFTSSELPAMTPNSRHFTKPQQKPPPKVGRALDENIQVTVISDGQTGPNSPRHSAGSYQFLDQTHPNPNPHVGSAHSGTYTNDVDFRPLPSAPNTSVRGHHNGGLQPAHNYNEIDSK